MDKTTLPDTDHAVKLGYLMGVLTTMIILTSILLFIGYRTGYRVLYQGFIEAIAPRLAKQHVIDIPKDVLEQLTLLQAVINNADNPTNVARHDTHSGATG